MKTVSLLAVLMVAVCLTGCEDPKLVTCQQEKDALTGQLEQANAAVAKKDSQIAALKAENTEMQTKAMESISTMMTKQAKNDKQLKAKIVEKTQQIKDLKAKNATLEKQIAEHKCAAPVVEAAVDAIKKATTE